MACCSSSSSTTARWRSGSSSTGFEVTLSSEGGSSPLGQAAQYWTIDEVAQAAQIVGRNGLNVEANWPILCDVFGQWAGVVPGLGLDSPASLAGLVGTIAKESAGTFAPVEEAFWLDIRARQAEWAKHGYGGGPQYHGRGFIQTTHVG